VTWLFCKKEDYQCYPDFSFAMVFWQVDGNWSPGYKNLTLNFWLLPFKPDTLTTLLGFTSHE